jgi:hypothetical protein
VIITSPVTLDVTSLVEVVEEARIVSVVDTTSSNVTVVSFGAGTMMASEVMLLVKVVDL